MAEWQAHNLYNYNQPYHAYYSVMFPPGSEQNQVNLSPWTEAGLDMAQLTSAQSGYCTPADAEPRSPEHQSSPESPVTQTFSGHGQYHSPGLVYLCDTEQNGPLVSGPAPDESGLTGSDSASDSEPQTSPQTPDSWSCGSSGEGCLPQADPATWAQKANLNDEAINRNPGALNTPINNICLKEKTEAFNILCNENLNVMTTSAPVISPKTQSTNKGKVRASFSESQMNALAERFNVQRYLTPSEMKNMAELTGLTYKQVKTWFQNRRMKLRRHQKDNSWASERYATQDSTGPGTVFTNLPTHMQPYEMQQRPALNQHVIEAAMKKSAPQNLTYYFSAMRGAAESGGYNAWPPNTALHSRPQVSNWPRPSDMPHFDYHGVFNPQNMCSLPDTDFKAGEQISRAVPTTAIGQGTAQ